MYLIREENKMNEMSLLDFQLAMAAGLFLIGALSFAVGVIVLVTRATGREIRTLATQTAHLAQKGLAEEVAGLVGNASALLSATNDLVRTTAGVGVFLSVLGVVLMAAGAWLVMQI
jgi:hypothetical protein